MSKYGDADGVRALHHSYGAAACTSNDQGTQLSNAYEAIGPANFMGNAAESWRSYVTGLREANTAMSKAFDRVGSFLVRVADAIEHTQDAEKAEIAAGKAYTRAKSAYTTAQGELRSAEAAASSPLSWSPGAIGQPGPTPAQLEAVKAAARQVERTWHDLQQATQTLQRARHRLEQAEDHRKRVLRQLSALCQSEVAALKAATPPGNAPALALSGGLIAELQMAERSIGEIPAIAGSFLAPDLLPRAMAAMVADARYPQFQTDIGQLYRLAVTPLKDFVPKPQPKPHGGGSVWDWLGAGVVAVTSGALIYFSAGLDSGPVLGIDSSLLGSMGVTAGVTGAGSETLAVGDALIHHEAIDPKALIVAGTTGWLAGAVPVGLTAGLLREAAAMPAIMLPTRAAVGAVTGAGLNVASQQYLDGNIRWGNVAVAAAGGAWGGGWPGAGDLSNIPDSAMARIVLANHAATFPSVVAAATDNAAPSAPKAHAGSH